jgi:hypothetical protein
MAIGELKDSQSHKLQGDPGSVQLGEAYENSEGQWVSTRRKIMGHDLAIAAIKLNNMNLPGYATTIHRRASTIVYAKPDCM